MSAAFVPSRTTDLADIDPTPPANAQVLVWISSTSKWTPGSGGGNVTSVFGRTGIVVAQAGDYGVAQVTGAAPLASPAFTGTPTAPTAAPGTNTTQVATTAFVLANGGAVSSVFGRTGAVVAQAGDYTAAEIGPSVMEAVAFATADDTSPTFVAVGDWTHTLTGGYSSLASYSPSGTGDSTATWRFLTAGQVAVQATWISNPNRASNAKYRIYDNTTLLSTVSVDQRVDPSGTSFGGRPFQSLATVAVGAGPLKVVLANDADGYVIADAIRVSDASSPGVCAVVYRGPSDGALRDDRAMNYDSATGRLTLPASRLQPVAGDAQGNLLITTSDGSGNPGGSGYAAFWVGQASPSISNYSFLASNGADGAFPGVPVIYFNAPGSGGVLHFRQNNVNVAIIRNGIWTFTNSYAAPYLSNVAVTFNSFGTTSTPIGIQAASGQTSPLTTWYDSTGTAVGWVRPDASLKLPALADASAVNDSAYYSSTQSTLAYKDSSGVSHPLTGQDTAPADLYVATTGNDTTGDGSSGTPYATVSKALSRLPDVLLGDHTVHVADGTYAAGIDLRRFISRGDRTLTIAGNTTTPANVIFTGTVTAPDTTTTGLYVAGSVRVLVQGITANVTATYGVFVDRGAILTLDRCTITAPSSNAISDTAVNITNRSSVEFRGNVTLSNWALNGIGAYTYSLVTYTVAGTLTITRPDSFGAGIHLAYHAAMICQTTGTNIAISGAKIGWQLGLHGEFQHIGGSSTLSASNGSTPSSSSGILCTDLSTWSTNQPLSLTHFTTGRESNSISYIEATGGITLSSVTTASSATQNSINNP